ncbi:cleavage and polyadenylation specificity factor-like protein [Leishmania major strain Friedlin]|uniref:Cleavage and polyadenylation specificity factor-like protein n=1 Tax=Leishmania major TaxID=5664 RepID=Q4Q5E8_LEIMA|nr:cleavage and polyadenylation specificity factor-like protein [Leishmania major strain Friedlin]CAG9580199.1 cleavage_and_polyadenylation_specificity_factor-_like_protein [Leishmania major strain Friedlin]CAJ08654.1 cleavage and polyadenylation specificity factor-like protein [Leishmania major strain Friedlin]|eukprot:XP_001685450.1 cleavage and polyadenylation specificity factor-like protein [Leishmania major strain Friedlin]
MLHTAVAPLLPASVVTHTVSGYFLPDSFAAQKEKEVVAIRQNHLTLYRVKRTPHACTAAGLPPEEQLGQVAEVSLHAPPLGSAVCRPLRTTSDVLVLLFGDFHVSFLQYNPVTVQFDTVALVQLDDRQLCLDRCPLSAMLRVDETGMYVAVLAKRSDLFFFPVVEMIDQQAMAQVQEENAAANAWNSDMHSAAFAGNEEAAVTKTSGAVTAAAPKPTVALNAWGDEDDDDDDEAPNARNQLEAAKSEQSVSETTMTEDNSAVAFGAASAAPGTASSQKVTQGGGTSLLLRVGTVTHWRLQDVKSALRNIRDVQFVQSAGEPLLAFLFEKQPTWAGRVKLLEWRSKTVESHMLTCSIEWMKVTLANSATPHMLSLSEVDGLPYDVTSMTPLPAFQDLPSAVFCVSRNMMVHVSTKSGYGVYVNATGEEQARSLKSSAVSLEAVQWRSASQALSTDLVKVNLNFANATSVLVSQPATTQRAPVVAAGAAATGDGHSQRLLVVTEEEGTVVDVHLQSHGYTVGSISAEIVMTGCFGSSYASIDATRFFLGALNGDSRFIASTPHDPCKVVQKFLGIGPVRDVDIVDTTTTSAGTQEDTLDASIEASPYADLFRSVELEALPTMTAAQRKAVMDIALCSGSGLAGSLSILRRSIRSRVVRQEELNAISVFFLEPTNADARKRPRDRGNEGGRGDAPPASTVGAGAAPHPHLLISGSNFSILFAVRSDSVQQVRGAALSMAARTVYAVHLDWMPGLLQVTETELRLLSADGKRRLSSTEFLTLPAIQRASSQGAAANVALSALLVAEMRCALVRFTDGQLLSFRLVDAKTMSTATLLLERVTAVAWWGSAARHPQQCQHTLVVVQNMDLVLYTLPSPQAVQQASIFPNFALMPPFAMEGVETPVVKLRERLNAEPLPSVTHLAVFDQHEDPAVSAAPTEATLVMILSSGELVTYRVVPADANGPRRCVKVIYHILDVAPEVDVMESIKARKKRLQEERAHLASVTQQMRHCSERLVPFRGLQDRYKGIYVCGQTPVFLVYHAATNQLVCTRHHATNAVRGFAPFHSRHVHGGFVYCGEGFVHFATMQPFGELLGCSGWWLERVRLGCTPHQVIYSPAAHGCFVVASRPQPFSPKRAPFDVQLRMVEDEEGNRVPHVIEPVSLPPLSATSGSPVPTNERYEVQFFSTLNWQCMGRLVLDGNEKVLSATLMQVTRDTTMDAANRSTTAPVCALATAYPLGEDVTTRGRILLLTTSQQSGQGMQQLRTLHEEPMEGPVTAITRVGEDCVAVAVGGTVRVYRYDANKSTMETMAILYAGAYVTCLQAFREYLVIGDLFNSVLFARYSEEIHTITILGRDTSAISVVSNDMLYHDTRFGLLVTDDARNLMCMSYKPRVLEEHGKPPKVLESLLTVTGEYRLAGGVLLKMMRLRAASARSSSVAIYVTNMGEIGYLVPLGDQTSRTGQWVVRRLQSEVAHAGGLPPRMFLGFPQDDPLRSLKGEEWMLHFPLLEQLYRQDLRTRKLVASAAQTQLERVMNVGATVSAELGHI